MSERHLRLFFALWPDVAAARATAALATVVAAQSGGKVTPPERIHLTLAFLGSQPASSVDAIIAGVASTAIAPFAIQFDCIGAWRKTGIAWLAPSDSPPALIELNRALVSSLKPLLSLPDERPFAPHVTLARRAYRTPQMAGLATPVAWRVDAFSLVCSQPGSSGPAYRRVAQWPLAAAHARSVRR
jgi:2'-5' RNA ligase